MTPEHIASLPYRPNVGIMVVNEQGLVFVAQRKDRFSDAWQMPQGGVDKGEDPEAAALRELEEETGITPKMVTILARTKGWIPYELPHDLIPKLWNGRFRGQEQLWFLAKFHGTNQDVNIETEEPEFSAWKWTEPTTLLDAIVPFKREVYAQVLAEFEEHLK